MAAAIVLGGVVWLAVDAGHWPFEEQPQPLASMPDASFWQFLFSDRVTLGFARLGLCVLAAYVIVSAPALVLAGRWLKTLGASGASADEAQDASENIDALQREVVDLTEKLDKVSEERKAFRDLAQKLLTLGEK